MWPRSTVTCCPGHKPRAEWSGQNGSKTVRLYVAIVNCKSQLSGDALQPDVCVRRERSRDSEPDFASHQTTLIEDDKTTRADRESLKSASARARRRRRQPPRCRGPGPRFLRLILCDYNLPDANGLESSARSPALPHARDHGHGENVGHIAPVPFARGDGLRREVWGLPVHDPAVIEKNLTVAKIIRKRRPPPPARGTTRSSNDAATDPLRGCTTAALHRVPSNCSPRAARYDKDLRRHDRPRRVQQPMTATAPGRPAAGDGGKVIARTCADGRAARYGGDEFVLLIRTRWGKRRARRRPHSPEYRSASAALLFRDGRVNMSIGVASSRQVGASSSEQLLARADAALYQSKAAGRDRVTVARGANSAGTNSKGTNVVGTNIDELAGDRVAETRAATNPSVAAAGPLTRSVPAA